MNPEETQILLQTIEKMIRISEPREAEYYKGYRLGIQIGQLRAREELIPRYFRQNESYAASGDEHLESYAKGYRDGYWGLQPAP